MRIRGGGDRRQEAAFRHRDVVIIADEILRHRVLALLTLARNAITFRAVPDALTVAGLVGAVGAVDPALEVSATAIVEAGVRIATEPDEDKKLRRRGAVAERVVYLLVRERNSAALREQEIYLSSRKWSQAAPGRPIDWSNQKDVVLDLGHPAFEVYETKLSAWLNQDDLNELGDIHRAAQTEGTVPFTILATLETTKALGGRLRRLTPRRDLYLAPMEDLLDLDTSRPTVTF